MLAIDSLKVGYLVDVVVVSMFPAGFCLLAKADPFCPRDGRGKNWEVFPISCISLSRVGETLPEADCLWEEGVDEFHITPWEPHGTASDDGLSWAEPEGPVGDVSSDPTI